LDRKWEYELVKTDKAYIHLVVVLHYLLLYDVGNTKKYEIFALKHKVRRELMRLLPDWKYEGGPKKNRIFFKKYNLFTFQTKNT
jgi:hypothetical protein